MTLQVFDILNLEITSVPFDGNSMNTVYNHQHMDAQI